MNWRLARFEELTGREVHDIFQARVAVFIVEQACVFQDLDGIDAQCWHLVGTANKGSATFIAGSMKVADPLLAYCRLVPPGVKYEEPSIGRVLTTAAARRTGAGREMMRRAVEHTARLWPGRPMRIGAQVYLEKFYGEFGFARSSEIYIEDGIPHIEMIRP